MAHSYQNWYDLVDVQEIVNAMPDETREKFIVTIIAPTTMSVITEEVINLGFLGASTDEATDWSCSSNETWWFDAIYEIDTSVSAKLTELQAMSEATALIIQADIINSDTSWQAHHTLQKQFDVLTEQHSKFCHGSLVGTWTGGQERYPDGTVNYDGAALTISSTGTGTIYNGASNTKTIEPSYFDSELLVGIATATGGTDYYLQCGIESGGTPVCSMVRYDGNALWFYTI